jgi:cytochrome c biogenesis protein CcdA
MLVLIIFAYIAGVVTILSPCILPLLPIILSSSFAGIKDQMRPYGIVIGFILSFTILTLFLTSFVRIFGINQDLLRILAAVIIAIFGISLLVPQIQKYSEILFSKLSSRVPQVSNHQGFWGGIIIGLSLGALWTPCVGPILASVITLALSESVTLNALLITLSYALGTATVMLIILKLGSKLFVRVPWLLSKSSLIQKIFGVLMILLSIAIIYGADRSFQTFVLDSTPWLGEGITGIENQDFVRQNLPNLR